MISHKLGGKSSRNQVKGWKSNQRNKRTQNFLVWISLKLNHEKKLYIKFVKDKPCLYVQYDLYSFSLDENLDQI